LYSFLEEMAKATTTLDLYSQAVDESKLAAQRDMALAIAGGQLADCLPNPVISFV
jgi:hypothetical protein